MEALEVNKDNGIKLLEKYGFSKEVCDLFYKEGILTLFDLQKHGLRVIWLKNIDTSIIQELERKMKELNIEFFVPSITNANAHEIKISDTKLSFEIERFLRNRGINTVRELIDCDFRLLLTKDGTDKKILKDIYLFLNEIEGIDKTLSKLILAYLEIELVDKSILEDKRTQGLTPLIDVNIDTKLRIFLNSNGIYTIEDIIAMGLSVFLLDGIKNFDISNLVEVLLQFNVSFYQEIPKLDKKS